MSVSDFESAYFCAADLKRFGRELGITVGNARKHEVESLIVEFLVTGKVPEHHPVKSRQAGQPRDRPTSATLVVNYMGDKRTKSFLLDIVHSWSPTLANKSGSGTGSTTGAASNNPAAPSSPMKTWLQACVG